MSVKIRPYRKRGKSGWEVDIVLKLPTGEVIRERVKSPVSSKSGSKFWAEQREAEMLRHGILQPTNEKKAVPTLIEFKSRFLSYSETNNKPSTVASKEWALGSHLVPYFGNKRLDEIDPASIEVYKATKLKEGQSPKSVNNHLGVLRKLLNLAQEWNELLHVPKVRALKLPEQTFRFMDFTESSRFMSAAPAEWKVLLTVALKTGLRLGELLALRWEDLDLVAGKIVVRRTLWRDKEGTPKGGKSREVPLSDEAVRALRGHRHLRGQYVFCDEQGNRLNHKKLSNLVPMVCKKAGLAKRLTMHDLRHTFASHLVMRGVTLKAVQELLGHVSIDMTLRYAHLSPDVKRDAVKLLDLQNAPEVGDILETQS